MRIEEALEVLDHHQKWRCDNNVPSIYEAIEPKRLTEAINVILIDLKDPNRKAIDLIRLLEANLNLRYIQYHEGEDPADYPKRVLKGEGFMDAVEIVKDFYEV